LTPLQKLPKNVGDLGILIVAKGFKKLPKLQKIAQSGHPDDDHPPASSDHLCPTVMQRSPLRCCPLGLLKAIILSTQSHFTDIIIHF